MSERRRLSLHVVICTVAAVLAATVAGWLIAQGYFFPVARVLDRYEAGTPSCTGEFRLISIFPMARILEGRLCYYHKSGQLKSEMNYKYSDDYKKEFLFHGGAASAFHMNNEHVGRNGAYKVWDDSGKLIMRVEYKNGKADLSSAIYPE